MTTQHLNLVQEPAPRPVVIVGYGHAGRNLHRNALEQLGRPVDLYAVDPAYDASPDDVPLLPDLADCGTIAPIGDIVFHVTTPPADHVPTVTKLVELGARSIIVEKPVARTPRDAWLLRSLGRNCEIVPMSVWPHSRVTTRVIELLAAGTIGAVRSLDFEQNKPRFARPDGHRSAFSVELPHQVLLALHLAGGDATVAQAASRPAPELGGTGCMMGGADLTLLHDNGVISTLRSDLTAPERRRRLRVTGDRGEIIADYPLGEGSHCGQVRVSDRPGRALIEDRPIDQFLDAAYSFFDGNGPRPVCGLRLHQQTTVLLAEAETLALDSVLDSYDRELVLS
ncbi:Gfo/Idh/MocA family protein [Flexivirga meconopsidis]|uniref:Gfo/Idh/MocA family protein n=1 Tax=Flexivirga meconopsidis TaxID=2977121 RepID=UPI0022401FEA|nr:hypothetical protein [Flexivirga meconopsidis]